MSAEVESSFAKFTLIFGAKKPADLAALMLISASNPSYVGYNFFIIGSLILIASASRRPRESLFQVRLEQNIRALGTADSIPTDLAACGLTINGSSNGSRQANCFHCGVGIQVSSDASSAEAGHTAASPNCYITQLDGLLSGKATARQAVAANAERFHRALTKLARDLRSPVVESVESFGFSRSSVIFAATRHFMLNGGTAHEKPGSLIQCVHDCIDEFGESASLLQNLNMEILLASLNLAEIRQNCSTPSVAAPHVNTLVPAVSATNAESNPRAPIAASSEYSEIPATAAAASAATDPPGESGSSDQCTICRHKTVDRVLLPCAHFCICSGCLSSKRQCPKCGSTILATVKAFIT